MFDKKIVDEAVSLLLTKGRVAMRQEEPQGLTRETGEDLFDSLEELLVTGNVQNLEQLRENVRDNLLVVCAAQAIKNVD